MAARLMTNLEKKARCCASDLCFLRPFLAKWTKEREEVERHIQALRGSPTEEQINAAWQLAAIIHEQIRKQNAND